MRVTSRGKIVFTTMAIIAVLAIYYLVSHINWVGDHYCWGTITQCYFGEGK